MLKRSLSGLAVTIGSLALSLTAGSGVASADPDFGPVINTNCTYEQAMAALHAQNPMAANYLENSPPNKAFLQQFMVSSPDQRLDMLHKVRNAPGAQEAFPIFKQMLATCNNY